MDLSTLGVSDKKQKQFHKKQIFDSEDLVKFYPRKYIDYRYPKTVATASDGEKCSMILIIQDIVKKNKYVEAVGYEISTKATVSVKWFHQMYIYNNLLVTKGMEVVVCGTYTNNEWGYQFTNPDVFSTDLTSSLCLLPIYSKITGMSDAYLKEILTQAIDVHEDQEVYDEKTLKRFNVIPVSLLPQKIHHPNTEQDIKEAQKRLIFDDLYTFARHLYEDATHVQQYSMYQPISLTGCNRLIQELPYELTPDQQNIIMSFVETARSGKRVNALIQGDVGSGKTVCAFLLMLTMADNGYQSVLMAPTGVLAKQHYEELKKYVEPMGYKCVYLSGELKKSQKKEIMESIKTGEAHFVVGTHSVISDSVEFSNLALTIVDEEHKFGVTQREALRQKAQEGVHSITMSATPIPRSLAMTLYGNSISIYTINTMPNGRMPVKTCVANNNKAIFEFMHTEIKNGHQCYIVCPLIAADDVETSDNEGIAPIESVESVYQMATDYFYNKNVNVGMITGKMKDDEKNEIIHKFEEGEFQMLIATTIIEVGVNVPNATVMTIMNADRFGLAGLHQLRGRVGRSNLQSYCILKSNDLNNERLQVMCETTNGFEIAKEDLKIRGTGDFIGTKQSGDNHYVALMLQHPKLYEEIKQYIEHEAAEDLDFIKRGSKNG